jgi:hypothetical protein
VAGRLDISIFSVLCLLQLSAPSMAEAASVQQQTVQSSSKSHSLFLIEIPKMVQNWTSRCLQQDKSKQKSAIDCWRNAAVALEAYTSRINGRLLDQVTRLRLAWLERAAQLQFLSERDNDANFRAAEDTESRARRRFGGRQPRLVDRAKWQDERQSERSQLSARSQSLDNLAQRTAKTAQISIEAVSFSEATADRPSPASFVPAARPQTTAARKSAGSEDGGERTVLTVTPKKSQADATLIVNNRSDLEGDVRRVRKHFVAVPRRKPVMAKATMQETSNTAETKKTKKIVAAARQKPDRQAKPRQLNVQPAASADENARVAAANEAALEAYDEQVPTSTKGMRASEVRDLCKKRFGPFSQVRRQRGEWYCTQP